MTWDQKLKKIPGTRDWRRTLRSEVGKGPETRGWRRDLPVDRQKHRRLWKHYLPVVLRRRAVTIVVTKTVECPETGWHTWNLLTRKIYRSEYVLSGNPRRSRHDIWQFSVRFIKPLNKRTSSPISSRKMSLCSSGITSRKLKRVKYNCTFLSFWDELMARLMFYLIWSYQSSVVES